MAEPEPLDPEDRSSQLAREPVQRGRAQTAATDDDGVVVFHRSAAPTSDYMPCVARSVSPLFYRVQYIYVAAIDIERGSMVEIRQLR